MNETYLIIYHEEDNDGLFSAALIYNYLRNALHIEKDSISFLGMTYAKLASTFPDKETLKEKLYDVYTNVFMTDISFNDYKQMIELKRLYENKFVWIDHHAPIITSSMKYKFDDIIGERDTSRSALLLAYRFLYDPFNLKYNNGEAPILFRMLSAYDSWSYERENVDFNVCRNVNKGVDYVFKLDITKVIDAVYNILYDDTKSGGYITFERIGATLNEYDDIRNTELVSKYGDFSWKVNGTPTVMLMLQGPTSSLVFKSVKDKNIKHGIVLKYLPNGNYVVSLYNINTEYDKEFHCGNYLKTKYNGGGHAGAAGCTLTTKQFQKIMKTKEI